MAFSGTAGGFFTAFCTSFSAGSAPAGENPAGTSISEIRTQEDRISPFFMIYSIL